jgi:hypothetical protein
VRGWVMLAGCNLLGAVASRLDTLQM